MGRKRGDSHADEEVTMITRRQLLLGLTLWTTILLMSIFPAVSRAQDLSRFSSEAQSFLEQNQQIQALGTMRKAVEEVWNHIAFHAVRNVLVKEKAAFYGQFEPRSNNVYPAGEIIRLYVEPVGFTQKKEADHYVIALEADFVVAKEGGTIIGGKEHFWRFETKSKNFMDEFFVNVDYTLTGFTPGNYEIKTVFRDLRSPKTLTVHTPIRIE